MDKYPRTYHLSFSPEIHSDDKVCDMNDIITMIDEGIEFVITEKIDGGNTTLHKDGVFARSHSKPTTCPTFNYIKNVHYYPNFENIKWDNVMIFGENMFAIHSIEYTNLKDYFYVFNIMDRRTCMFYDYFHMVQWSLKHNMKTTPLIYSGKIESLKWLEEFLFNELQKPSELGGEKEGFVIRRKGEFNKNDFSKNVFKYVRKGHVQTDEHWSKHWRQAKINREQIWTCDTRFS